MTRALALIFTGIALLALWFAMNTAPLTVTVAPELISAGERIVRELPND